MRAEYLIDALRVACLLSAARANGMKVMNNIFLVSWSCELTLCVILDILQTQLMGCSAPARRHESGVG